MENQQIVKLDQELVNIVQDFLFLSPLSWPKDAMSNFLKAFKKGNLRLPKIDLAPVDCSRKIAALDQYIKKIGYDDDPILTFLRETALSYLQAYQIIQGQGTPAVTDHSKALFGSPKDKLTGYKRSNLDIADYFIRVVEDYRCAIDNAPHPYGAGEFKRLLEKRIKSVIKDDQISVTIDDGITARATAGSNYVKIRKGARFSENDLDQLFHHEVMIHTLTYINGRKQPLLKTLGYNAPRTTATQEGLAVFAEYINSSIELDRLKRIALRIVAIDMAESGADFIDVFRYFHRHGQNAEESYLSAMRIFRGCKPEGGQVFYKDNVYLSGLIEVSAFMKTAMHQGFIHDIALLFCGKLTANDVLQLKPAAEEGLIADPTYVPSWARNSSELAAHLAINDLTERFRDEENME